MRVVDAFVTPVLWPPGQEPEYIRALMSDLFHRDPDHVLSGRTPDRLVEELDAAGVDVAILNALPGRAEEVARFVEAFPERFVLTAEFDPRGGMATVREIRRMVAQHDLAMVRMVPFQIGLPPSHAAYFPIFAACVDLGIAASVTTGMPGPPMPAEPQRPLHLDDVCRYFPELVLVMAHGADPWWDEAIRLMVKFPNLHLMISDCAPRHLPVSLIQFMNTRGRSKVLFATGYPVMSFERCRREAESLDLRPGVLDDLMHGNAERLFGLVPTSTPDRT